MRVFYGVMATPPAVGDGLKARVLKKTPRENGWVFIHQEGSHETWEHPEHRRQQFAAHTDKTEFGKALMSKIAKSFKL